MRLQRGVSVAGLDPELARNIAKACNVDSTTAAAVAERVGIDEHEAAGLLGALVAEDFLKTRPAPWNADETLYSTTIGGAALAMASFLRPVTRAKADQLLAGVLERATTYNADQSKPLTITQVAVFGSYLDPTVLELGDLDLAIKWDFRDKTSSASDVAIEYARVSGKHFASFIDELGYPEREVRQLLRNRSGYVNVHVEDPTVFTDRVKVVYQVD